MQETPPYSNKYLSDRYLCWTMSQSRYILGDHDMSYVVGFGSNYPKRANDRGAACPSAPQNCTSVNSLYNPSPNPHVLNGALVYVRPLACQLTQYLLLRMREANVLAAPLHLLTSRNSIKKHCANSARWQEIIMSMSFVLLPRTIVVRKSSVGMSWCFSVQRGSMCLRQQPCSCRTLRRATTSWTGGQATTRGCR